jgi:hypothetical protein
MCVLSVQHHTKYCWIGFCAIRLHESITDAACVIALVTPAIVTTSTLWLLSRYLCYHPLYDHYNALFATAYSHDYPYALLAL